MAIVPMKPIKVELWGYAMRLGFAPKKSNSLINEQIL